VSAGGALLINEEAETPKRLPPPITAVAVMTLMGVGSLFPWNAFITPLDYYALLFKRSSFENSVVSVISATFTGVGLVAIIVLQGLQHSFKVRTLILFALALEIVVFILIVAATTALLLFSDDTLDVELPRHASLTFALLLVCVSIASVAQATLTGSVLSYASMLGSDFIKAISGGMGVAGLLVSTANLLTELPAALQESDVSAAKHAVITSALWYFCASVFVLLLSLAGFLWLERMDVARVCKLKCEPPDSLTSTASRCSHPTDTPTRSTWISAGSQTTTEEHQVIAALGPHGAKDDMLLPKRTGSMRRTLRLLAELWHWGLAVVLCYSVTIGIFPALVGMLAPSVHNSVWKQLYVPSLFVAFNAGDVIGRNSPLCIVPNSRRLVLFVALLRFVFVPVFIFSHMRQGASNVSPWFKSDALEVLIMLIFAWTNGWLTTTVFVRAPASVAEGPAAGTLMAGCLNTGLTIGSLLSFLFHWVLCRCNPLVDSDS